MPCSYTFSRYSEKPRAFSKYREKPHESNSPLQAMSKLKGWPTSIQCEMNVEEWGKALWQAGLLSKYTV
jgi:hypothetical protein